MGRQLRTVGLSTSAIFSISTGYFSVTLEMRPALLYSDRQSVRQLFSDPKMRDLNDLEWLFCVKLELHGDGDQFKISDLNRIDLHRPTLKEIGMGMGMGTLVCGDGWGWGRS